MRKLGEAVSSPVAPARSVRTGDFTWACATPHPPLELWVVLRNARGIEHERREIVRPAADETREALIAFP